MSGPSPSRISKLYDAFLAAVAEALPCHVELLDANDLFENPAQILKQGFGLTIGDGENDDRCMESTAYYYKRDFTVVLVREVLALASDAESRKQKWKLALEDLHLVLKALTGLYAVVGADGQVLSWSVEYTKDSGPRDTQINDVPYVFIELTVSARYREPTTGGS